MRDQNIVKSMTREVNMRSSSVKDKTKYSRKEKYKSLYK
jgi:hypothetical protein